MMRFAILVLSVSAVCLLSADAQDAKKLSDADVAKLVVGKWRWEDKTNKIKVDMAFTDDKTFTSEGMNGDLSFKMSGTWEVEKGALELTIKKSTMPNRAGVTEVHKVFSVDEESLKIESKGAVTFKKVK